MNAAYIETVRLLIESVPAIFETPHLAMKGGTAINLFIEDMPRLSVDIDVVYTDHQATREEALKVISTSLETMRRGLTARGLESTISFNVQGEESKLFIRRGRSQVKVEINHVFRGTLLPVKMQRLTDEARNLFTAELSAPLLAVPELYGSKLVAAMDRQHPRDFFDVRGLFERGGFSADVVESFVCYLAGHNRPVHEVLFPRDKDIASTFENEFSGMTRIPVTLDDLLQVRRKLKEELPAALTPRHRRFLHSLVAGDPEWPMMKCSHLSQLSAIRWKLQNLLKLKKSNPKKFTQQAEELRSRLAE